MSFPAPAFEPTADDLRLIDEAIRRVNRTIPLTARDRAMLATLLPGEIGRGRRDLFSLVRAARKAIDQA